MLSPLPRLMFHCALMGSACAAGCAKLMEHGKSPLAHATMSPDSVALEIFFVRVPLNDEGANGSLWEEIDEQRLDTDARRRLTENGFRIGVAPAQIPKQLQQLLQLSSENKESSTQVLSDLVEDSPISRRILQTRRGQRNLIQCSGIYESLPLLQNDQGQVAGKTYSKAQGTFTLRAYPQGDGQVRLNWLPELHYGETRQSWVGNQGAFRLEAGQSKKIFEDLSFTATLAPGELLVLASRPGRPGSLGHHFLTQPQADSLEQKLLLVRLSQTQYNDLFGPELLELPAE